MKLKKAMALALAGALVLTTAVTGTTSEAAKKTKLKTKKVSIFVKGKKKISITGKKAKHKYTFTSQKKKIAKVSKKGVITGVKAGKTTITVKDTWKQKGKKKTKKLGTVKVTVKKKTIVKTPVPPVQTPVATPAQTPVVTPAQTPVVTPPVQPPVVTPPGTSAEPGTSAKPGTSAEPGTSAKPGTSAEPGTSAKPGTSAEPGTSAKPGAEKPTPEIHFSNVAEGATTTATVSVDEGKIKDVTWSVENEEIATVVEDATDPKKATITGVKAGKTKVTATVDVTVDGKDFTVTAGKELIVSGANQLVVNVEIETAPSEIEVGDELTLKAKADVDTSYIEEIIWEISSDAATIETDSLEAAVTGAKAGKVTVTVTIKVKKDGKEGEATASKEIEVIYVNKDYDMVFSPDTYAKKTPWFFVGKDQCKYSNGGVSFPLAKAQNRAIGFDLTETGEKFDLSKYSKAQITLSSSEATAYVRVGFTEQDNREFKDTEVQKYTGYKLGPGQADQDKMFEVDLSQFPQQAYAFVIQNMGWNGDSTAVNPTVTIKSIKLIAKK